MKRIGAYGGTFDPVHNGHLEVARAVVEDFDLDRLLIIPACVPPHKEAGALTNSHHRFAMAVLATIDAERTLVSTLEVETPHWPYTFETIERLRGLFGEETVLFFVMGADSFEDLSTWRRPDRLLQQTNLIVVTRPGHEISASAFPEISSAIRDVRKGSNNRRLRSAESRSGAVYVTDSVNSDISSTEIRARIGRGESIDGLVPPLVADYITKYELYR
jgi:nicotinate-nucleotide adenylyltransferase